MQFTIEEKEKIEKELLLISNELNNDMISDLYKSCNKMRNIFPNTFFGDPEYDSFQKLNNNAQNLHNDTVSLCNKIEEIVKNAGV